MRVYIEENANDCGDLRDIKVVQQATMGPLIGGRSVLIDTPRSRHHIQARFDGQHPPGGICDVYVNDDGVGRLAGSATIFKHKQIGDGSLLIDLYYTGVLALLPLT